ncbi:hypothetical protein H9636_18415 [Ureibacillus sp. Re31]|uniref:Uncharacterized protein n=1 Tax=Ureibacillus galli TaxID=2762222 RepID=A0ABR8XHA2_9BACL|nr:hypothetical protein [Ureibacillus galli]MBD8028612.1 hypothetical protein [Ureibacillus galli]
MEDWDKKRAELEKKVLESQQTIRKYERTLRPYREVTDSEYKKAKKRLIEAATEIHQGDFESNKPMDPLVDMSISQLKELYDKEKAEYKSNDIRKRVNLMRIQTKIQQKENEKMEG